MLTGIIERRVREAIKERILRAQKALDEELHKINEKEIKEIQNIRSAMNNERRWWEDKMVDQVLNGHPLTK